MLFSITSLFYLLLHFTLCLSVHKVYDYSCETPRKEKGSCKPLIACASYYLGFEKFELIRYGVCDYYGNIGFCCPDVHISKAKGIPVVPEQEKTKGDVNLPLQDYYEATSYANDAMEQRTQYEDTLHSEGYSVGPESLYWAASRLTTHYTPIYKKAIPAMALLEATNYIKRKYALSGDDVTWKLHGAVPDGLIANCSEEPKCYDSKYRSQDGSCNNIKHPTWGQIHTSLDRIIPADYSDGIWGVKKSYDGGDLPNPRVIRTHLLPVTDKSFNEMSLYVMNWGQFVSHDLSHVPNFQYPNGKGIDCCDENGGILSAHKMHPQCFPMYVEPDDNVYGKYGRQCISITRAVVAPKDECKFGYADQMNQVTHWMDMSQVYGSSDTTCHELRSHYGGRMKTIHIYGEEMLPVDPEHEDCPNATKHFCFKAGDIRNNQQPGLLVLHTIFVRLHNKIATELNYMNPHWDDETCFQETRRITIAIFQHISYNEYLPLLLGYDFMRGHGFVPLTEGHSDDYDEEEQPIVLNEFAAASYRMGHSLVWGVLKLINEKGYLDAEIKLRHIFNNPKILHEPGTIDKLVRGYLHHEIRLFDRHFDEEISNHLFQGEGPFGLDLPAINIHRGRDHGLPGYNYYREMCNLTKAHSFEDFLDVMQPEDIQKLKYIYKSVDDVDLFVGGSLEKIFPDSLLGQTFWCIVGYQFQKQKVSDRYWYDLGGQPHSFTIHQLNEIRKVSLARLICQTTGIYKIQPLAFRSPKEYVNPIVDCEEYNIIPEMSLAPWKEIPYKPYHHHSGTGYGKKPFYPPPPPPVYDGKPRHINYY